jgi:hypothetical protein
LSTGGNTRTEQGYNLNYGRERDGRETSILNH